MRVAAWSLAALLAVIVAGCSSSKSSPGKSSSPTSASAQGKTMPNVTGQALDKAEDAIQSAGGDPDKVKEIGGGKFGIVVKSNWTVCSQSPAAGQALPSAPQLTVDRTCPSSTPASSAPASSSSASSGSNTPTTLTAKNNADLAALLKVGDNCASSVQTFATKYAGREIEFDGKVARYDPHADQYDIRHDILIGAGPKGTTAFGPSFQFQNESDSDLHLSGAKTIKVSDNLHIVAEVGDYNSQTCNFQLIPVSTKVT